MMHSPNRCAKHDLAVGPNGQCVLCIREATTSPNASRLIIVLAMVTSIVAALAVGIIHIRPVIAQMLNSRIASSGQSITYPTLDPNDVQIKLYHAPWCGACQQARAWLDARSIPYIPIDIEKDPRARQEQRKLNPSGMIPTLEIDVEVLIGFNPTQLERSIRLAKAQRESKAAPR